ncbi:MAG TPA: D-alanine--D-alanine ligase [Ignavibacteriales bacterium]|nr:D-alanine--D-alanine ligase [Ignavibacteriales bacterium]
MKKNIALVVGGISSEREISLKSGFGVYNSLIKNKDFNIKVIDPALGLNQYSNNEDYFNKALDKIESGNFIKTFSSDLFKHIDLAFIMLHGKFGEDGFIQNIFEVMGIKHTGSMAFSCALSMDKKISKIIFEKNSIPTAKWIFIDTIKDNNIIEKIQMEIGLPCVIKPVNEGSSFGMSICHDVEEINNGILLATKYSSHILVEKYIKGREFTVGVLGDLVLPPLEIKPKHEYYDYQCKYTKGMTEYEVPANISKEQTKEIQNLAKKAVDALGAYGFPRVDFLMDENGNFYCLEVNALPGMTETSLFPKMANAIGIDYDELVLKIINLAENNG